MRRFLPHLGIALGVCIVLYAVFSGSSDEDAIRKQLDRLEAAVAVTAGDTNPVLRGARVKNAFVELFIQDVTIEIPELSSARSGRIELVGLAAQAPSLYRTASVDLGQLVIKVDEPKLSALAYGDATLTGTRQSGGLEEDKRTVSLRFDKVEGAWLIVAISVSAQDG